MQHCATYFSRVPIPTLPQLYRRSRRHADATRGPKAPIPFIVRGDDLRLAGHLFTISERTIGRRLLPSDENRRHASPKQSSVTRCLGILQSARYTVRPIYGRPCCKFVGRRAIEPLNRYQCPHSTHSGHSRLSGARLVLTTTFDPKRTFAIHRICEHPEVRRLVLSSFRS